MFEGTWGRKTQNTNRSILTQKKIEKKEENERGGQILSNCVHQAQTNRP